MSQRRLPLAPTFLFTHPWFHVTTLKRRAAPRFRQNLVLTAKGKRKVDRLSPWQPACQELPSGGSPMTYMLNGRQHIVVAVSGGNYSGEYLSFALPREEPRPTN